MPQRDFAGALVSPGLSVIAEVKRRSPSKGAIDESLDPAQVALAYEAGGAAAISVLTDQEFFGGCEEDLAAARGAVGLPVLRKDFTVAEADVYQARAMGADAILLIVAALSDQEIKRFHNLAVELGMAVLVEAHDQAEIERALDCGARIVGVNQRNLSNFEVDLERAAGLVASIPDGVVKVAESGLAGPGDARRAAELGYDAVLVGEHLLRQSDRTAAVAELVGSGGERQCL